MPNIQVDYSYFVKEEGTIDHLAVDRVDSTTIDDAVETFVKDMFADSGDEVKDIQSTGYVELKD